MNNIALKEMMYLVEETVESIEGAAAQLDSLMNEGTLYRDAQVRLFAVRDTLCMAAGRVDVISDMIDREADKKG